MSYLLGKEKGSLRLYRLETLPGSGGAFFPFYRQETPLWSAGAKFSPFYRQRTPPASGRTKFYPFYR